MTKSSIPTLDDLVTTIESRADDPLQRLTAAVLVANHLDELADHLIGHFVDEARQAGASWTTIGQGLGVTKQAAQKRFVPTAPEDAATELPIFARYTEHARMAIIGAQQQAHQRNAAEIRPGHILLALLEDNQVGHVDADALRTAVSEALGTGEGNAGEAVPFAAAGKKALELGHREALRRGSTTIEPQHILLGVLSMTGEPDIAAATALGLDKDAVG